ncbi:MAG: metallophosphoesterase [Verrucomicrobiales bacterium]|nr:metallophosphoesterase [Verrucomicrobiales bacterium]
MIDPHEKSTEGSDSPESEFGFARVAPDVLLDGRLVIFHEKEKWMAVSDLHFGYEVSRRRDGGLWPLWGMQSIRDRLAGAIARWAPHKLILVGDIVDSAAAPKEAIQWLESVQELGPEMILIAGNHDRGSVRRHFPFVDTHREGHYFFHHGHQPRDLPSLATIEVHGHIHPSIRFGDGAGTSLKLPIFTREKVPEGNRETWTLPAFSPWAGGHPCGPRNEAHPFTRWACGGHRVFEVR